MMPKKRINLILIPAAVLVWLLIIMRVISFTNPEAGKNTAVTFHHQTINKGAQTDTLTLLLNYRDPFNKKASPFVRNTEDKNEGNVFNKPVEVFPPEIKYKGFIKAKDSGKDVVLIIIEGKSFLLCNNDTAKGIKIIRIGKESLSYQFSNKIFSCSKLQ